MKKIITMQENGAILNLGIISDYLVIYYENSMLYFWDINELEISYEIKNDKENKIEFIKLKEDFKIIFQSEEINISTEKEDISLVIYSDYINSQNIRFEKIYYNKYYIQTFYNSYFYLKNIDGKILFEGKHNNWVSDADIINDTLYTVGYDSCIKRWNIKKSTYEGYYSLKNGWITAVKCDVDGLYIGNQFGELFFVDYSEIVLGKFSKGAIWNIYNFNNSIYSVSEGGEISLYSKELNIVNEVKCSDGWITAMAIDDEDLLAVSSCGEIFSISMDLKEVKEILKMNYWFNSVITRDYIGYAVTAEGDVIKFDYSGNIIDLKKVSRYQLIDIICIEKKVYVADVEGHLFVLDLNLNVKDIIEISGIHITSICCNENRNRIYISTMDEKIVMVDITGDYKYKMIYIGQARSWKIDYIKQTDDVVLITTNQEIICYDGGLENKLLRKKCIDFLTTCKMIGEDIWVGDDKGKVIKYKFEKNCKIIAEEYMPYWYGISNKEFYDNIYNSIILFYDSTDCSQLYRNRDKKILDLCGYNYQEIDVSKNDKMKSIVKRYSGWSKFPQIIFYGYFISSASVLPQMFENGTLRRCVTNVKRDD